MKILKATIIVLVMMSCKSKQETSAPVLKKETTPAATTSKPPAGSTKGTIVDKTGLDGCSFLIQKEDGSFFEPISLADRFKVDGMKIYFTYRLSRKATTCMSGQPIIIGTIQPANN